MNNITAEHNRYTTCSYNRVYAVLILLTVASWMIGKSGYSSNLIALSALGIALVKGLLIGDYYIGLRGVQSPWRWAIIIWLVVLGVLISWAFIAAA